MKPFTKYKLLKILASSLRALHIPFGVFAGASLAIGNYRLFIIGLILTMIIVFVQQCIFWKAMENLESLCRKKL